MNNLSTKSFKELERELSDKFAKYSFDDLLVDSDTWKSSPFVAFNKNYMKYSSRINFTLGRRTITGIETLNPIFKNVVKNFDKFSEATIASDIILEVGNTKFELERYCTDYKGYIVTENSKGERVLFDMLKFMPLYTNLALPSTLTFKTDGEAKQGIFQKDNELVAVIMGLQVWDDINTYADQLLGVRSIA